MTKRLLIPLALTCAARLCLADPSPDLLPDNQPTPPTAPPAPRALVREKAILDADRQLLLAQTEESDHAEKALAEVREELAKAGDEAREALDVFNVNNYSDANGGRERNLLIANSNTNVEQLASLDEDLSIMARIVDKTLAVALRPGREPMLGIFVKGAPFARSDENIYLEGQGVVFVRAVRLPLVSAGGVTTDQNAPPKDSARQEAKGEVDGTTTPRSRKDRTSKFPPYDSARVEGLKRDVIAALKNAANISALGNDETITVVLLGPPPVRSGYRDDEQTQRTKAYTNLSREPRPCTMSIKIKKSDAAAALAGNIDVTELQKRASISLY